MKKTTPLTLIALLLIFSSCSSYLTSSENVSKSKKTYEKVLVLGRSKDNTSRVKFENQVVEKLKANGIMAVASHTIDGTKNIDKQFSEIEVQTAKKKLVSQGFDGAIITNLIDASEYTDVIPGNSSTMMIPTRYGRFGRYYSYYPLTTWESDQLTTGMKYVFESSFYHISTSDDDNLQWLGRFELTDPSSLERTTETYATELVRALVSESIVSSN